MVTCCICFDAYVLRQEIDLRVFDGCLVNTYQKISASSVQPSMDVSVVFKFNRSGAPNPNLWFADVLATTCSKPVHDAYCTNDASSILRRDIQAN